MTVRKPNLFIVGAPKCGTTAWVNYLARHKEIFFCDPKEPHFFNTDIPRFRWFETEEAYLDLFSDVGSEHVVGEASILYLYSRDAAENIARFNPDAKILIFVRAPEKFIPSYHQQQLYNLDEDIDDLAEAWSLSGLRSEGTLPNGCRDPRLLDYKSIGAFGAQASRFIQEFGAESVRILDFDQWVKSPRETYCALLEFFQLVDDGMNDFPKINAAHDHRSKTLAALTQRPPNALSSISQTVRKIPGLKNFRPARLLRKLNRSEGYRKTGISSSLEQEIISHYREDQIKLRELMKQAGLRSATPVNS